MLVTGIIDLVTGRLVDVLPARSAVAVTGWLAAKPAPWLAGIGHVVIDPCQPYATAAAKGLPAARVVVDHFHVIRLANAALDEVRRRTQNDALGHRGRKRDPLYRIRRRLLASHDRLDPAGFARMLAWLHAGDPEGEVGAAYLAKELLRDTYLAGDALEARRRIVTFYDHCTRSEVPELERLARTIARWERPILSWPRTRLTNAATEGTTSSSRTSSGSASGSGTSTTIDSGRSCAAAPHGEAVARTSPCCAPVALCRWNIACADRLRWEVGYRRHSLRRLCVVFISFHSVAHIRWPRQTNRSKPRTALCCANTGSIIAFLRP
jgi:transposase